VTRRRPGSATGKFNKRVTSWDNVPDARLDVSKLIKESEQKAARRSRECVPMDERLVSLAKSFRERRL
jgi:hypothetical protein